MTLTTKILASYLGKSADELLSLPLFSGWVWRKSVEDDLDPPLVDYISDPEGIDFVCDEAGEVETIFVYNDNDRRFAEAFEDLPFSCTRQDVRDRLGRPSKSGEPMTDEILGRYGPSDRFENERYTIHVEYHLDSMSIKQITLMRADVVP
jgi:hypothetical protein